MGCRHSSSPPESPVKIRQNGGPVVLKSKISIHRAQQIDYRKSNGIKTISSKSAISVKKIRRSLSQSPSPTPPALPAPSHPPALPLTSSILEQTLDGRGKSLIKRFELDSPCLLFDVSLTHILLLDGRQLRLINMETMHMQICALSSDCGDVQEIGWSSKLDAFLVLTTDQLYRSDIQYLHPVPIHQIQFTTEGHRKSYMAIDGDDLLINRSFGYDVRRYSLSTLSLMQSLHAYRESENICVTTIRLNSNKVLALAVSIGTQQMIDLVNLNSDRLIRRVILDGNENILYPIDLHNTGQWFAKTCVPCVNIGHCLLSSGGQVTRLTLFPNQDNFVRSLRMSCDNRWLLVVRQHAVELYQPYTSLLPLVKDSVGFSSISLKQQC